MGEALELDEDGKDAEALTQVFQVIQEFLNGCSYSILKQ